MLSPFRREQPGVQWGYRGVRLDAVRRVLATGRRHPPLLSLRPPQGAVQYSTVQYSTVQYSTVALPFWFCVLPKVAAELNIHSNITFVTEAIYNSSWIYENWIEGIIFNRIESAALQSKDISDFSPSQQNRHRQISSDVALPPATM